jgi:hypothetical protein
MSFGLLNVIISADSALFLLQIDQVIFFDS